MFGIGCKARTKSTAKNEKADEEEEEENLWDREPRILRLETICDFGPGAQTIRYFHFPEEFSSVVNPKSPDFPCYYQYKLLEHDHGSFPPGYIEQLMHLNDIAQRQHISLEELLYHLKVSNEGRIYTLLQQQIDNLQHTAGYAPPKPPSTPVPPPPINPGVAGIPAASAPPPPNKPPVSPSEKDETVIPLDSKNKLSAMELQALMEANRPKEVSLDPTQFAPGKSSDLKDILQEIKAKGPSEKNPPAINPGQEKQNINSLIEQIKADRDPNASGDNNAEA